MKILDAAQDHPVRASGSTLLELCIDPDALTTRTALPALRAGALAKQK